MPNAYPAALEKFWISRAIEASGNPEEQDTALRRMEPKVQALSDLFTAERPSKDFPDYFADRSLLAAYGLFFFPQSMAKAQWALDFAVRLRGWAPPSETVRILDLGAGAGPCGLGLALALHEKHPGRKIRLTALDHSPHALAALKELAQLPDLAGWLTLETVRHDLKSGVLPALGGAFDLVVAGFALNEMFASRSLNAEALPPASASGVRQARPMPGLHSGCIARDHASRVDFIKQLRPLLADTGLLIVLEPAFKPTAEPLTAVSDALAAGPAFFRWGPQLAAAPCPFLSAPANGKYWDHEVRLWTAPESLAFINRRLFRDIATLKFSCAILGASPPPPWPAQPAGGAILRLASPIAPLKGRFVFSATTTEGALVTVQVPLRGMSRQEEKEFELKFERGDVITCQWTPLKEAGWHKAEAGTLKALHAVN